MAIASPPVTPIRCTGTLGRSYGIQVARLAGLPSKVVDRAKEILQGLERDELSRGGKPTLSGTRGGPDSYQMGLFATPAEKSPGSDEVARRLRELAIDDTTPRRALEILAELKETLNSAS